MLVSINRLIRRSRNRVRALLVASFVAVMLLAAHSALAGAHMGDTGTMGHVGSMGGGEALAMCLAIVETAAVACIAVAVARLQWRPSMRLPQSGRRRWPLPVRVAGVLHGRARDGPDLQVFVI